MQALIGNILDRCITDAVKKGPRWGMPAYAPTAKEREIVGRLHRVRPDRHRQALLQQRLELVFPHSLAPSRQR